MSSQSSSTKKKLVTIANIWAIWEVSETNERYRFVICVFVLKTMPEKIPSSCNKSYSPFIVSRILFGTSESRIIIMLSLHVRSIQFNIHIILWIIYFSVTLPEIIHFWFIDYANYIHKKKLFQYTRKCH